MYGLEVMVALFMLIILCFAGMRIWIDAKKRVPEKQPLQKGTLTKKLYRNYTTKVV
ncbi:Uncharacterised protein [Listeria monocytogenes]|nr:hypothetical protein pLIS12_00116c [Listeria monocytogenes]UCZ49849.1 hypothetical protein pLIS44_00131c [Listeria innocua]UCK60708.1 hypothetical protein pLIS26_00116c [Listeria monocytogenes]CWV84032.1 Uncharacterised protein [Listeria monocytogenes]CWW13079.1 Uncharacterised protein [Listeria monocytogenes]